MANSATDARAIEETASEPSPPAAEIERLANDGETPNERAGDVVRRASSNGLPADADGRPNRRERMTKWLEDARQLQKRIRAERGDSPPTDAARLISELREERVERIASANRRAE